MGTQITLAVGACAMITVALSAAAQPKPNEPAHGWIPTPAFTSPSMHQKFTPASTLKVNLSAKIPTMNPGGYTVPGPFDFVTYAKASPHVEKWHIDLIKQGPGGSELLLQKFEGLVTSNTFSLVLDGHWFAKHGTGKYGARAYLTQTTEKRKDAGMATGVGFELQVPVVSRRPPEDKVGPAVTDKPLASPTGGTSTQRPGAPSSQLPAVQRPPQ
jgi:hypothetical protein